MSGVVIYHQTHQPKPLIFVNIPAEDAESEAKNWQPLMDYLTQELGHPVELRFVTDYAAATEALKYGHADIVRYGSSSYVLAEKEVDLIPIASVANADSSLMTYQSFIITRADSGITDASQLAGHTFAYADIGSTTGYLLPATYFKKNGIELGETFFAGNHPAVIEAVKNGTVDAGATADTRYQSALEEGAIRPDELRIIWKSDFIPRGPTVVRADMPIELREAIAAALMSAPEDIVAQCNLESARFGPAPADVYEPIREIQRYLGLAPE
jgi:phosphonate transport system substrate-binding protein